VEDTVVFLPRIVFISVSFSIASGQVTLAEKPQTKINSLKTQKD